MGGFKNGKCLFAVQRKSGHGVVYALQTFVAKDHSVRTTLLTDYFMFFPLLVYITIPVKTGRVF
jgi:hypothetical protein